MVKPKLQKELNHLGPVVQSIVSLMKSLVNDSLSLQDSSSAPKIKCANIFCWKNVALQKLLTFFRQKMAVFLCMRCLKF